MVPIKYISFQCDFDDLEAKLNEHGLQGWRLHTCEPVVTMGPQGSGNLHAFVVMDMALMQDFEQNNEEDVTDEPRPEGIPMKG